MGGKIVGKLVWGGLSHYLENRTFSTLKERL